jgi:hypothetical protein
MPKPRSLTPEDVRQVFKLKSKGFPTAFIAETDGGPAISAMSVINCILCAGVGEVASVRARKDSSTDKTIAFVPFGG